MGFVTPPYTSVGSYYTYGVALSSQSSKAFFWSFLVVYGSRSRIWGRREYNKFVPVLGRDGTKIVPPGNIFDQPSGKMSRIRGKLPDHVGDHVV